MILISQFFHIQANKLQHFLSSRSWQWFLAVCGGGIVTVLSALVTYQNIHADASLQTARNADDKGQLAAAHSALSSTNHFLVAPWLVNNLNTEGARNQKLIDSVHKQTSSSSSRGAVSPQQNSTRSSVQTPETTAPQKTTRQQAPGTTNSPSTGTSTSKTGAGSGSGVSGSSGGNSSPGGGSSTPPPPGPMSHITANLVVTTSPSSASQCYISQTVNFSVDGSGDVTVRWKVLSTRTSGSIFNPTSYSFNAAGSSADATGNTWQGLEPGDSYRISAVVTDTANPAVTVIAGPFVVSSCAAPPQLMSTSVASYMTHITPGTLLSSQYHDSLFSGECSMTFQAPFSVDSSGSIQAVYTITSNSSGGATLYGNTRHDFSGPAGDTDTSYTRMPHLNNGDVYTINATIYDLANHAIQATAGPIVSGCS